MTTIESKPVEIGRTPEALYEFLSAIGNFEGLMPSQVESWKTNGDECRFRIRGMADLGMRISKRTPHHEIKLDSTKPAPFSFTLFCTIEPTGSQASRLTMRMDADLNPMLKMMAAGPLENFLNYLAEGCVERG